MIHRSDYLFTSESVSEGHPDKVSDQISDAVLDLFLAGDKGSRVACETLVTTNYINVAGEVSSQAEVSKEQVEKVARQVVQDIGYVHDDIGFNAHTARFEFLLDQQSPDIAQGVTGTGLHKEEGAGDQGFMFGFATNETDGFMPASIYYSHKLLEFLAEKRKKNEMQFLRPDAKSQITFRYQNGKPVEVDTVVISTQHSEGIEHKEIEQLLIEEVIKKVLPPNLLVNPKYFINPTGRFVVGGPHGDCGLTGRKIIVDTYGGYARHGGGAFSGKDPSKVDRSAAYMARYIAKNIVASEAASMVEIQLAYAIGVAKPVSVFVNTFGTGKMTDEKLEKLVFEHFDMTPSGIRESLQLREQKYLPTASYGHFGRSGQGSFSWEATDKIDIFK